MKHLVVIFCLIPFVAVEAGDDDLQRKQLQALQLESEIELIDKEIRECGKSVRNWKVATVIGSVGTVATGTGVIVQSIQLNKAKKEGKTEQPEVKTDKTIDTEK
jgi:hypothetical protein